MTCQLRSADVPNDDFDMELAWNTDFYPAFTNDSHHAVDTKQEAPQIPSDLGPKSNFVSAMPPFTHIGPIAAGRNSFDNTMDPAMLWPLSMDDLDACSLPCQAQTLPEMDNGLRIREDPFSIISSDTTLLPRHTQRTPLTSPSEDVLVSARSDSLRLSTSTSTISDNAIASSPVESEKTRRARYAANARHSKAQKARKDSHHADSSPDGKADIAQKRKERHLEKNKIAAAKCRARQRKQVQTIQGKGSHLAEKNVELKTMVQELRGELNGLRLLALNHQQCDCHVTRYNLSQAERVVAEYRSLCNGQHLESFE